MPESRYFENIQLWLPSPSSCAGKFAIPSISPLFESDLPKIEQWKPFGEGNPTPNCGLHMYLCDYRIERLWNTPNKYVGILKKAVAVCSPDYSVYTDVPTALGIYNHYKKHWLGAWWQNHGITVVPTICWGNRETFSWCFDGEPTESVVTVSSVGTQKSQYTKRAFKFGYDAMMERLRPELILFCGNIQQGLRGNILPMTQCHMANIKKPCKERNLADEQPSDPLDPRLDRG